MVKYSQLNMQTKPRQHGAVAIIVALCLTILVGMLGLVLDLGHLYIAKTELQNAADAAALSGAERLNGTAARICCAADSAQEMAIAAAAKNNYDFNSKQVTINASNISFSSSHIGPWVDVATAMASPSDKTFVKVDTGIDGTSLQSLNTWFIQVLPGVASGMKTFGMAVAGKYVYEVAPLGICALTKDPTDLTMADEDIGFKRGVTYLMADVNPLAPGTQYWINPVTVTDTAENNACPSGTNSEQASLPYMCTGKVNFMPKVGQFVYTNPGISTAQVRALNSRFNIYTQDSKCDPITAPPDKNIKPYVYNGSGGQPKDWMDTAPTQQSISFGYYGCIYSSDPLVPSTCTNKCVSKNGNIHECVQSDNGSVVGPGPNDVVAWRSKPFELNPVTDTSFQTKATDYGVLWSASRPVGKGVGDWPTLYKSQTAKSAYPEPSPYSGTDSNFLLGPTVNTGKDKRRMMNIVIVNCHAAGGNCRPVEVLGVGKFLLQTQASENGKKDIYLEYAGLLPTPLPPSDIRLYQ